MPRWDKNDVCHPNGINKSLQQITDYENNNKFSQRENARKGRGHLNHKLFSENIFFDPLTVFSKPTGATIFKIMW